MSQRVAGTWKCRMGVHLWKYPYHLWRGERTHCLRCGAVKVGGS